MLPRSHWALSGKRSVLPGFAVVYGLETGRTRIHRHHRHHRQISHGRIYRVTEGFDVDPGRPGAGGFVLVLL